MLTNRSSHILYGNFHFIFNQLFIFARTSSFKDINSLFLNNSVKSSDLDSSKLSKSCHNLISSFQIFVLLSFVTYHHVHNSSHKSKAILLI
ncbi:hypothetical protein HOF65_08715 [bacterium]|nr:hypothetical protein [bacterium]